MRCPVCDRSRPACHDQVCRTCRRFIAEYIDTGQIRLRPVPAVADVWLVMRRLGVTQDRAVRVLGRSVEQWSVWRYSWQRGARRFSPAARSKVVLAAVARSMGPLVWRAVVWAVVWSVKALGWFVLVTVGGMVMITLLVALNAWLRVWVIGMVVRDMVRVIWDWRTKTKFGSPSCRDEFPELPEVVTTALRKMGMALEKVVTVGEEVVMALEALEKRERDELIRCASWAVGRERMNG